MKLPAKLVSHALFLALSCGAFHAAHAKEQTPASAGSGKHAAAKSQKNASPKAKAKLARDANAKKAAAVKALSAPESLARFEDEVMALPAPERARAMTMMLMLTSLVAPALIEDANATGMEAANYASGVALERLQKLAAKAGLHAAATCMGRFAKVEKDPAKSMAFSFPKGCAALRELHALDNGETTPKVESLAIKWATGAVQEGLAQARKAGLTYRARARPVNLVEANK